MARQQVEIIVWPVKVRRHHRDEVAAVLSTICLAKLQAGNLSNSIPLVRWLEWACQKAVFAHRLRRQARIDARRSEEHQLLDGGVPRGLDYVNRYRHVIV